MKIEKVEVHSDVATETDTQRFVRAVGNAMEGHNDLLVLASLLNLAAQLALQIDPVDGEERTRRALDVALKQARMCHRSN